MTKEMQNLRKFDLNLLIIFEAIYSSGNISRAGKVLGLSQPTISNALNRLRYLMKDRLFVRAGSGVQPTSKAIDMIAAVREALNVIEETVTEKTEFDPYMHRRHFRIILLDQLEPLIMPKLVNQVSKTGQVSFETFHIWNTPVRRSLYENSIDLVLAPFIGNTEELECEAFGTVELSLISRKNHPHVRKSLTIQQFERLNFAVLPLKLRAMSFIDEELHRHGIKRKVTYTLNKIWSFPAMVSQTDLVGIVPRDFGEYAASVWPLETHELPFLVPTQQLFLTWKKSRSDDQGLIWLRNQIRHVYDENRKL